MFLVKSQALPQLAALWPPGLCGFKSEEHVRRKVAASAGAVAGDSLGEAAWNVHNFEKPLDIATRNIKELAVLESIYIYILYILYMYRERSFYCNYILCMIYHNILYNAVYTCNYTISCLEHEHLYIIYMQHIVFDVFCVSDCRIRKPSTSCRCSRRPRELSNWRRGHREISEGLG